MIHGHVNRWLVLHMYSDIYILCFTTVNITSKLDYTAVIHGFLSGYSGFPVTYFFNATHQMTVLIVSNETVSLCMV